MIRQAVLDDKAYILEILKEIREEGLEKYSPLTFDDVTSEETVAFLITSGVALVAEKEAEVIGCILGTLERSIMDKNQIIGIERIWALKKKHRKGRIGLKLLKEFERICKYKGATHIMVGVIISINQKSMRRIYERFGYTFIEEHFAKRIS